MVEISSSDPKLYAPSSILWKFSKLITWTLKADSICLGSKWFKLKQNKNWNADNPTKIMPYYRAPFFIKSPSVKY